jgi:nitrate reductase gamma subunit
MEQWLAFARGPLFTVTFLIMLLGLARHVLVQLHALVTRKRHGLRRLAWRRIAADTLTWTVPVRHLIPGTIIVSAASFLLHLSIIPVSLFLASHVQLWEQFLGVRLPALGARTADALTLTAIACLVILLGRRLFGRCPHSLSRVSDYIVLVLVLLPVLTGFLAAHPAMNPLPWNLMMLVHILSAEVLFVAVPFTKLAHIVLFPFDRLSEVHWQLRPGAGDQVARAIFGEEAQV